MRIAICDDDAIEVNRIEGYLDGLSDLYKDIDIDSFCSGEEFIKHFELEQNSYDIIFLDMKMGEINGIETAKKLRELDQKAIIIYISSHQEYVFDCFEVNPFRFLVKPVCFEEFSAVFALAWQKVVKGNHMFCFTNKRMSVRIHFDDILYFESIKRIVRVHTKEKSYEFYDKLISVLDQLGDCDFIQVHKSYIVNLNAVKEMDSVSAKLLCDIIIPISESFRKNVKSEYLKFLARSLK